GQDIVFFEMLSIVRRGTSTDEEERFVRYVLEAISIKHLQDQVDLRQTTILTSRVKTVHSVNNTVMKRLSLQQERLVLEAIDDIGGFQQFRTPSILERDTGLATTLMLWPGARIVFTSNIRSGHNAIVNGTVGEFVRLQGNNISSVG
ncbi:hypothetical protein BGZ58_006213, partial [Dissophora ornata]